MSTLQIVKCGSLWVAHFQTPYGCAELLCGEGKVSDMKILLLVEQFLAAGIDYIAEIRRSVFRLPRLWRPIRFAVNNEGRLGVQFKHRLTGRQDVLLFADEHSAFQTNLADITIEDGDMERLVERNMSASR